MKVETHWIQTLHPISDAMPFSLELFLWTPCRKYFLGFMYFENVKMIETRYWYFIQIFKCCNKSDFHFLLENVLQFDYWHESDRDWLIFYWRRLVFWAERCSIGCKDPSLSSELKIQILFTRNLFIFFLKMK